MRVMRSPGCDSDLDDVATVAALAHKAILTATVVGLDGMVSVAAFLAFQR